MMTHKKLLPNTVKTSLVIIISLFISHVALSLPQLEASVDKSTVGSDEALRYSIVAANYQGNAKPDLTPLSKDFQILNRGQSSQVSIVNNKATQYMQWTATLLPKRTGDITIPSIKLGEQRTNPIQIKVLANKKASTQQTHQVFLKTSAKPTSNYVQAQIIYSLKIYYSRSIRNPNLNFPSSDKYIVKQLEPDQRYSKIIDGVAYQVLEMRVALFPQQSGDIDIPAPILTGYLQQEGPRGSWMMNPVWKQFQASGEKISLHIKPIPQSAQQKWWLPAQNIRLAQSWSEPISQFKVGTPITRTITLDANGLTSVQLPNISLGDVQGVQTYPDKPVTDDQLTPAGIMSSKTFKIAYIPNKTGKLTLPAISIPWWNTKTNRQAVATLAAQTIEVKAGAATAPTPHKPVIQPLSVTAGDNDAATAPTSAPRLDQPTARQNQLWFWLANLFLLLWVLTMWLLWRYKLSGKKRAKQALSQQAQQHIHSVHKARSHLKKVCLANDTKQAKISLLNLAHAIWRNETFLSLGDVANKLSNQQAITEIKLLDKLIYTQSAQSWDGLTFWDNIKNELNKKATKQIKQTHPLPNLYLGDSDEE